MTRLLHQNPLNVNHQLTIRPHHISVRIAPFSSRTSEMGKPTIVLTYVAPVAQTLPFSPPEKQGR